MDTTHTNMKSFYHHYPRPPASHHDPGEYEYYSRNHGSCNNQNLVVADIRRNAIAESRDSDQHHYHANPTVDRMEGISTHRHAKFYYSSAATRSVVSKNVLYSDEALRNGTTYRTLIDDPLQRRQGNNDAVMLHREIEETQNNKSKSISATRFYFSPILMVCTIIVNIVMFLSSRRANIATHPTTQSRAAKNVFANDGHELVKCDIINGVPTTLMDVTSNGDSHKLVAIPEFYKDGTNNSECWHNFANSTIFLHVGKGKTSKAFLSIFDIYVSISQLSIPIRLFTYQ